MAAVLVQNARKSYGKKAVLDDLCMCVPKGSIYGLLGASGCGKTTLLSCIVGTKSLQSGSIWVLGGKPRTKESGVPGPKVGYMPQEISLVAEFTVQDAIYYFGRLFNMKEEDIEERFTQLSTLLDLPPRNRFIRNCSGGQQRRISFAASMVHLPELLILDEPTVGVDPILRERIWDHLVEMTRKGKMAVIITTHYIEEARQADVIGLMRHGRLLAENSPAKLLSMFQTNFLEEVFLMLSQKQHEGRFNEIVNSVEFQNSSTDISVNSFEIDGSTKVLSEKEPKKARTRHLDVTWHRTKALLGKNWKQMYRNIPGLVFIFMFPIMQNCIFLLAVGGEIKDINLAIVNDESSRFNCDWFNMNESAQPYNLSSCHFYNASCRFLTYLDHPMIHKVHEERIGDALDGIKHGRYVGALHLPSNFTESLEARVEEGRFLDEDLLKYSEIKVWLDMSNRQVGAIVKYKLLQMFFDFEKDLFRQCDMSVKHAEYIQWHKFYAVDNDDYTAYMTPGLILTIMFFMMALMTSHIVITDRSEGVWERSTIAGVSAFEISLTHFVFQAGITVIYTTIVLVITFAIFKIDYAGPMWVMVVLTFLQGLDGVAYGYFISAVSGNVSVSNLLSTGSFFVMILMCGIMWPLEGMPVFLQWISKCLPFTITMESFRNVMKKGWGIDDVQVYNGILIESVWLVILLGISTKIIQSQR